MINLNITRFCFIQSKQEEPDVSVDLQASSGTKLFDYPEPMIL